jgi:hypothetical protein
MKVAVIGAGIFGLEAAIQLSTKHEVSVFEQKNDILLGATSNSTSRLHLGLHYPRNLETAVQSKQGFVDFERRFTDAINGNFTNYYALSNENSRVNLEQYLLAAKKADIQIEEIPLQNIFELGFNSAKFEKVWKCKEKVIDMKILKNQLSEEISNNSITLSLNSKIDVIEKYGSKWRVTPENRETIEFDAIVKATYGADHLKGLPQNNEFETRDFHLTLVLEISTNSSPIGMTVVDGDFFTMLPNGFSSTHLIYGPGPSVIARAQGTNYPIEWDEIPSQLVNDSERRIVKRMKYWAPGIEIMNINSRMQAIRTIQSNVSDTDRRVSQIIVVSENYYELFAGKIDHAVSMAKQLSLLLN